MKLWAKNATTGWKAVSLAMVCALMLGTLTACDENVNATLVTGLNSAANGVATTLINAAFQTVTPNPADEPAGAVSNASSVPQV